MKQYIISLILLILTLANPVSAQITIPNTFTPFTVISSNSVNQNFTELGNKSLNRTGGTLSGNMVVDANITIDGLDLSDFLTATQILTQVVGSAATPSYSVVGDTNTGMYFSAADQIAWSVAASKVLELTNTTLTMTGGITATGTVTAGTFSGSGASLTNIPAANLTGTIASAVQDLITRTGTITSGVWNAGSVTSSSSLTASNGDLIFGANSTIRRGTSDGSDNGNLILSGGGAVGSARGGHIFVNGNEHATLAGDINLVPGNVAGAQIVFYNTAGTAMFDQDASNGAITTTSTAGHNFTGAFGGSMTVNVRNSAAGAANLGAVQVGNDISAQTGILAAYSSTYTPAGGALANGVQLVGQLAGGLSLAANNASGDVRIYSRNALAATFGASQALVLNGTLTPGGNIILGANFLSGDGGNEGVSVSAAGVTSISGQLTMGGNIALGANRLSGDGDNEGITISSTGVVTTSSTLSMGGNILLNATWLSGDGGNEGLQVSSAGVVSTSGTLTVGGASISIGTTPATTGVVRIPNSQSMYARNAANTENDQLIGLDASNVIQIGLDTNATRFGSNVTILGTLGAGAAGTEFVVNSSGLITTQSVGTAAVRTATGSFSDTDGGENAMNDYGFFPSFEMDDCTAATFIQLGFTTTNQTNDTVARVGHTPTPGSCSAGSYDARWRYITASDNPDIWVEKNNVTGQVTAVWQSEDPVENPLSQVGHTSTRLELPTANEIKSMLVDLDLTERQQVRIEFLNYLRSRGWASADNVSDALDEVSPRYHRAAKLWAIRSIATVVGIDPSELIMDTMESIDGRVKPKANYATVVRNHKVARISRLAERGN